MRMHPRPPVMEQGDLQAHLVDASCLCQAPSEQATILGHGPQDYFYRAKMPNTINTCAGRGWSFTRIHGQFVSKTLVYGLPGRLSDRWRTQDWRPGYEGYWNRGHMWRQEECGRESHPCRVRKPKTMQYDSFILVNKIFSIDSKLPDYRNLFIIEELTVKISFADKCLCIT